MPQERIVDETGQMDVAASGSSLPPAIYPDQAGRSLVQATAATEQAKMLQPEDSLVSDSFTVSSYYHFDLISLVLYALSHYFILFDFSSA